jgi:magnesium-transporting ATPase (P-type)
MEWYNAKQVDEYTDSYLKTQFEKEQYVDLSWVINAMIALELIYILLFFCFTSASVRTWMFGINLVLLGVGRYSLKFSPEYSFRDIPFWIFIILLVGVSSLLFTLFTPFKYVVAAMQLLYLAPLITLKRLN